MAWQLTQRFCQSHQAVVCSVGLDDQQFGKSPSGHEMTLLELDSDGVVTHNAFSLPSDCY